MAEEGEINDALPNLEEMEQPEGAAAQGTARPDLFGDSESDEEEEDLAQVAPAEKPGEVPQDLNPSVTYELEGLAAEGAIAEAGERQEDATGMPAEAEYAAEEEPASQPDDLEPLPESQADKPYPGQSAIDDVFASDSEDEEQRQAAVGHVSEAEEEEDEFEAMFKGSKKNKRNKGLTNAVGKSAEDIIFNMESAAEVDYRSNEAKQPAVNKIMMLAQVEAAFAQSNLHQALLDKGILGALKLWIEPMPDFSLPNVKVRSTVLRALHQLPIDLQDEGRKLQLKKSQLGRYVAFYSKLGDETLANRKLAQGLVERWSRAIYEQYKEGREEDAKQEQEAQLALERKRRQQAEAKQNTQPTKRLKQGDPGFRWHATIPAPAKLDYMRRPDNKVQAGEGEAVKGKAKPKDRMSKKLAAMSRKGSRKASGDGKVSLQGRGLLL